MNDTTQPTVPAKPHGLKGTQTQIKMALTYKVLNSNFEKMNGKSLAGSETFGGGKVG